MFSQLWRLKSKVKVPVWSISGEGSLPGLWMVTYLLCPHMTEREKRDTTAHARTHKGGEERERERRTRVYQGTNPILRALPSYPHINLIISQKPHLQTFTLVVGDSTYEFRGGHIIHSVARPFSIQSLSTYYVPDVCWMPGMWIIRHRSWPRGA